jgi:hypothetical protein
VYFGGLSINCATMLNSSIADWYKKQNNSDIRKGRIAKWKTDLKNPKP